MPCFLAKFPVVIATEKVELMCSMNSALLTTELQKCLGITHIKTIQGEKNHLK